MKKLIAISTSIMILMAQTINVHAIQDTRVLVDTVQNTYSGREEAVTMINNLNFADMPNGHWAKESVARAGALNIIKGDDKNYRPDQKVSTQDAIAFVIRTMGMESQAQLLAPNASINLPANSPLKTEWALGYLALANQLGIITQNDYNQAISSDQAGLTADAFRRTEPATREQISSWII
jgi:hypothetical protein